MLNEANIEADFINRAKSIIIEHLSDEQFGVSELAEKMNMSRSNLLRKIKKNTKLSASQFIRLVRLEKSMELLKETSLNISEISFQVGFGSTSYFIKCFKEQYGFPPGEVRKGLHNAKEDVKEQVQIHVLKRFRKQIFAGIVCLCVFIVLMFVFGEQKGKDKVKLEKSIAVLPFKNESSDSANLYFVNGLIESSINNLQKIKDLRVISRTSVEQYRHTNKNVPDIAEELDVNYLVEGSGQRIGDRILLNVQLIDATTDKTIWVEQYNKKVLNAFDLQNEVAKKIAEAIKAKITSDELNQIELKPTENTLAYDYYLQALALYSIKTKERLGEAVVLLDKAIEQDPQFSLAYAHIAFSYFYIDLFQKQKQYTERINNCADKALLYNF